MDLTVKQDEECVAKQNVLKSSYEEKLASLKSLQKDLDKWNQEVLILKEQIINLGGADFVKLSKERDKFKIEVSEKQKLLNEMWSMINVGSKSLDKNTKEIETMGQHIEEMSKILDEVEKEIEKMVDQGQEVIKKRDEIVEE